MSQKIKDYLGISIIMSLTIFIISLALTSYHYSQSLGEVFPRSFSVQGEGRVTIIPDIAQFSFSVITEGGKDTKKLLIENTQKMNTVTTFVKNNGVESKDIKTENYNLEPRYKSFNCGPVIYNMNSNSCQQNQIVGYTITQTMSVKIRDFSKIGLILNGIIESGANSTSGISFTLDDVTKSQNEARVEAIQKAQKIAHATAEASGFYLGKLININENAPQSNYDYRVSSSYELNSVKSMATSVTPTIEPGTKEIIINVVLSYEIQ